MCEWLWLHITMVKPGILFTFRKKKKALTQLINTKTAEKQVRKQHYLKKQMHFNCLLPTFIWAGNETICEIVNCVLCLNLSGTYDVFNLIYYYAIYKSTNYPSLEPNPIFWTQWIPEAPLLSEALNNPMLTEEKTRKTSGILLFAAAINSTPPHNTKQKKHTPPKLNKKKWRPGTYTWKMRRAKHCSRHTTFCVLYLFVRSSLCRRQQLPTIRTLPNYKLRLMLGFPHL